MDPFEPFRPLMIPMSGVDKMCLLTLGDKSVLAIAETHQDNFCRHKGFTPFPQILNEYLANTEVPIDLMVEMLKFIPPSVGSRFLNFLLPDYSTEARQILSEYENRPLQGSTKPLNILELLRILIRSIPSGYYPNARIHWLEFPTLNSRNKADQLLGHFEKFMLATVQPERDAERRKIDLCLIQYFAYTPPWSSGPDPDRYNPQQEKLTFNQHGMSIDFLHCCYDALRFSKYFRKCYGDDPSRQAPPWEIYRDAFLNCWAREDTPFIDVFYSNVQRFFVDMYTCCRILKQDPRWFKNIVIYAGEWHVDNYIYILSRMGYAAYNVVGNYDSMCQKREAPATESAAKRRRGGTRKRR